GDLCAEVGSGGGEDCFVGEVGLVIGISGSDCGMSG
ncbi:hypothetical protein L195_g064107, partial [Trifolium pratense]